MGYGIEERSLNLVDYVCYLCHLIDGFPDEEKKDILSARVRFAPHESTPDLIIDHRINRYAISILYSSEEPPKAAIELLQQLSDNMVNGYFKSPAERGEKRGRNMGGLEGVFEECGNDMSVIGKFFSFDELASERLGSFHDAELAVQDPDLREVLHSALAKVRVKEDGEHIDRKCLRKGKANAIYIPLMTEVFSFRPIESALLDVITNSYPDNDKLKQAITWPVSSPGVLEGYQFMDSLSESGMELPFESRQEKIKLGEEVNLKRLASHR